MINKYNRIIRYFIKCCRIIAVIFLSFNNKNIPGLGHQEKKIWLKNFRKRAFTRSGSRFYSVLKEFLDSDIRVEKKLNFKTNNSLILICVIKNDLEKLKVFFEHYRKLGINQFAFLDDKSTDGTREYILSQNDTELFTVSKDYKNLLRIAWINRILAYYGFNRWYLVVDSDELLVFDNFENRSLTDFIISLNNENITAASGIMIDMYPKIAYTNCQEKSGIYDNMDYFDKSGYFQNKLSEISGGMRYRCFNIQLILEKTPLFYLDNKTIFDTHSIFPFNKNFQKNKNSVALLHYKFLPEDYYKYKERVELGNMSFGSIEYKAYMKIINENNPISFYDENISEKYTGSNSLIKHNLLSEQF